MIRRTQIGLMAHFGKFNNDTVHVWGEEIVAEIDGITYREPGLKHGSSTTPKSELEAALSFLSAAGEAYSHMTRERIADPFDLDGNGDRIHDGNHWLFHRKVTEWAANHADEIALAQLDLQEGNIKC